MVIGATGHIGSFLVPRLVRAGDEVLAVSRGEREPYHEAVEWRAVQRVKADRVAEEDGGTFGKRIADLEPDAVVDLICFTPESAQHLIDALGSTRPLLLHCGTIWVHGRTARVPVTEDEPRTGFGAVTGTRAVRPCTQIVPQCSSSGRAGRSASTRCCADAGVKQIRSTTASG